MEEISIWSLLLDISIISSLLLLGTILRARIRWIQSLFLPASMIAGFIGLTLGPHSLNILPFSSQFDTYPSLLIAVIFAAIPIGAKKVNMKQILHRVREMWSYSMLLTLLMWGGGAFFGLVVIQQIFSNIPSGFGLILGAGFLGGHGTAAAIGEAFSNYGWEDAMTLGMTAATIGILVAVVGGIFIIKRNTEKENTQFITSFKELPHELRTGLVSPYEQKAMGKETLSSNAIDPLVFHLSIIAFVVGIAYVLTNFLESLFPSVSLPLLSIAFVVALIFQNVIRLIKADCYIDERIMDRIGGSATDYLVAIGIASINITVVLDYVIPLIVLFIFGILWAYGIFYFIGPNIFKDFWFEKALFGWGWSTGTVAMGLALLRIVDPELKSKTMDDYALAYVGMVPVELAIITFAPLLVAAGYPWVMPLVLLFVAAFIVYMHKRLNLWGVRGQ